MDSKKSNADSISRRRFLVISGSGAFAGLAGCVSTNGSSSDSGSSGNGSGGSSGNDSGGSLDQIDINKIQPDEVIGKGPNGNDAVPTDKVTLSDSQVNKIKKGDYTVSIVFHYLKSAWVRLQRKALKKRFGELGITINGIYGSEMDVQKQTNILETIASKSKQIDGIVSIPVDVDAMTDAYQKVADSSIDIVFMDNVPNGLKFPEDYAGDVAADNRGNGVIGGRILSKIVGSGKVGMLEYDVPFYVTNERRKGALKALKKNKNITLVKNGFTDSNKVYSKAQNILTAHPDMKGMWVVWGQPPAMSTVSAETDTNRNIPLATSDLGSRTALNLAQGGRIKGLGAQRPYDQGIAEANMMGHRLLGNDTPPYVAAHSLAVMRKNLLDAYPKVFHEKPSQKITSHFN